MKSVEEKALHWLENYISNTFTNRELPGQEVVDFLKKNFNISHEIKLFRGINFKTKKEYDDFMSSLEKGHILSKVLTSWSKDIDIASKFAYKPLTIHSNKEYEQDSQMTFLWEKAVARKEKITGYRGVIITASIKPENTLLQTENALRFLEDKCVNCNNKICNSCNFRKALDLVEEEKEIIVLPQTIEVDIIEEILRFEDEVDVDKIDDYISNLTREIINSDPLHMDRIKYILHHHSHLFTKELKSKLYDLFKSEYIKINIQSIHEDEDNSIGMGELVLLPIHSVLQKEIFDYLLEEHQLEIKTSINESLKQQLNTIRNRYNTFYSPNNLCNYEKFIDKDILSAFNRIKN